MLSRLSLAPIQGDEPAQEDVPAQTIVPALADVLAQDDMPTQANVPPRADAPAQSDAAARGDYEAMAKRTRSISAHGSTCLAKKPRCSLTITISSTRFGSCRSCRGRF